jgi:hypothetical protein
MVHPSLGGNRMRGRASILLMRRAMTDLKAVSHWAKGIVRFVQACARVGQIGADARTVCKDQC